jgi:hypothetical protein
MKYGIFEYNTDNFGDEIQSIAARRFLPSIDYYFDRDNIDATNTSGEVKIIMNGWYTHRPENWPPHNPDLNPLLTSLHAEQYRKSVITAFSSKESLEFLNSHAPIGARGTSTLKFLQKKNVDTYFSGCLTLTLNKSTKVKRGNFILIVGLDNEIYHSVLSRTNRPVLHIDTMHSTNLNRESRFAIAEYYLSLYQSAHCVITDRLHCMLPCLAFGTPVLAISGKDPKRLEGLIELVYSSTRKEFLETNYNKFSIDNPPKNPNKYLAVRSKLEKTCYEFTSFDSKRSYLSFENIDALTESIAFREGLFHLINDGFIFQTESSALAQKNDALLKEITKLSENNLNLKKQIANLENIIASLTDVGVKGRLKDLGIAIKKKYNKTITPHH